MPVVVGGAKLRIAALPVSDSIVPPLRAISDATTIPSVSRSPIATSYSNTRMLVPVPPV